MEKKLLPKRLIAARESLGINKAEAARLLNLSKMGYGRYESGERLPSPQTLEVIAQKFGTSVEYLTGTATSPRSNAIVIDRHDSEELFEFVSQLQKEDDKTLQRLKSYYDKITAQ